MGAVATSWPLLRKIVGSAVLPEYTVEPLTYPAPVTVSWKGLVPAVRAGVLKPVMVGLMTTVRMLELAPAGLITCNPYRPLLVRKLAGITTVRPPEVRLAGPNDVPTEPGGIHWTYEPCT